MMGSRSALQEAVSTTNYGLNAVGGMTVHCQAVMLLFPLHQGLCSLCSIALGHLHDYFPCMHDVTTYSYAQDRLPVELLYSIESL